jgi:hypothetical protein
MQDVLFSGTRMRWKMDGIGLDLGCDAQLLGALKLDCESFGLGGNQLRGHRALSDADNHNEIYE